MKISREVIKLWQNAKIGDKIKTPMGIETITKISDCKFSTDGHYGNCGIWEGGTWNAFKPLKND